MALALPCIYDEILESFGQVDLRATSELHFVGMMSTPDSEPLMVWLDSDLAYSKSPVDDIPEWRRPNGGGAILQSGPRRKPYEEEPLGNAFSSSYPPRPSGPWVDQNGPIRPPHDRPGPNGPAGRWDRNGERDRERGRLPQEWDADEGG